MTDTALADSGPAPVDGAIISPDAPAISHPLGSQIPPDAVAKPDPTKAPSLDDSIDRAMAKSAEKSTPKADAKEPAKVEAKEVARGEGGKFAAKEPDKAAVPDSGKTRDAPAVTEPAKPSFTASEAPARFTETAKAKWASADPEIRGETERAIRELTEGHKKYKESAETFETYRELHDIAKQHGKEGAQVFKEYYEMENHLRKDPIGGLDVLCQKLGTSLREVAAHVMGQSPEQVTTQQDATIRELKQTISGLQEQVGKVSQTFEQQQVKSVQSEVEKFAADPAHSRFEELADDIAFFMKTRTKDLAEAYTLAERLNPVAAPATAEVPAASSAAPAIPHPDPGQKSIKGAPSSGSTPAGKKRVALSLDDALDRAFGSAG